MSEPGDYSKEWLESHAWELSRTVQQKDVVEDLDEFEDVVEALSMMDSQKKEETSQSKVLNSKTKYSSIEERLESSRGSDAVSSISSSSSPWKSTTGSPRRWHKLHESPKLPERLQEHEAGTSGSVRRGQAKVSISDEESEKSRDNLVYKRTGETASLDVYDEKFVKVFTAEEALRQRVGDLERKVNMLIAEEYCHCVTVPQGCFVLVLPGPGCAQKFTEDLIESLQSRIERVWPLCYFSPIVAKFASLATAILSWFPLPSPVYTCKFPPELEYKNPIYEVRKLELPTY